MRRALAVLERNTGFFPDSADAFGLLAYVHESQGDKVDALRCYRKIRAVDPKNPNADRRVRELGR